MTEQEFLEYVQSGGLVEVDDWDHVKEVTKKIKQQGLRTDAMLERVEMERFIYLMVFSGMTLVAAVALAVAALGITNTMLMRVLERVREIGVMDELADSQHRSIPDPKPFDQSFEGAIVSVMA